MHDSIAPSCSQVKNVERIELGRYEMETWYMSPLPPQFKDCKVGTRAANCSIICCYAT